ncbi:MAG: hypothetical protein NTW80_02610 [Deltaproteobacteria bacterium]|nr:hypothetical protein [Deltaproteobacteria bacterium]
MKTRLIAAVLVLLPLLLVNNLYGSEPASRYYPLKPGLTWTYKLTSEKIANGKIVVTNLPAKEINGVTVTPRKWDKGGMVSYSLMATDSMGIYRYGEQQDEKSEPVLTQPKAYSLRDPVAVGTTWDMPSKMGADELTVNLTVESITDSVKVPAGAYKDCVKIKHVGGGKGAPISIEAYEWYAPEVGLVKSIVTITKVDKDKKKTVDHLTYQLEAFKP